MAQKKNAIPPGTHHHNYPRLVAKLGKLGEGRSGVRNGLLATLDVGNLSG
jgi:hypothetical protein